MVDTHRQWIDRARHQSLALLLDLDGTLIPFADTVDEAVLDRPAANLLDALGACGVRVVIVSGRQLQHIDRLRSAVRTAWWVAEHGAWRCSTGDWVGPSHAGELASLEAVMSAIAGPDIMIERKSLGLCVHWRRVALARRDAAISALTAELDAWVARHPEYERREGVELAEIRHRSVSKASAVSWVREHHPHAHVVAIGDDDTDEDMFAALRPEEVSIAVTNARIRTTCARVSLPGPSAVRELLWWIVGARTGEHDRPPPIELLR